MLKPPRQLILLGKARGEADRFQGAGLGGEMPKSTQAKLIAACLAGLTSFAAPAFAGPLDANRALILTDNSFTADKTILDQACLMVELNYRMDEDEGLIFDPESPEVVLGRVPLRNLVAKAAEDSLARARETARTRVCGLAVTPEAEWTDDQKALRKRFPAAWSQGDIAVSAQRLTAHRGMRKSFRASLEASLPYLAMMDSVSGRKVCLRASSTWPMSNRASIRRPCPPREPPAYGNS